MTSFIIRSEKYGDIVNLIPLPHCSIYHMYKYIRVEMQEMRSADNTTQQMQGA